MALLFVSPLLMKAQEPIDMIYCSDTTYCIPSVVGMPRGKGIVVEQERILNYRFKTRSDEGIVQNDQIDVNNNNRWKFKFRFPILNKDKIKLVGGFKYYVEEYRFDQIMLSDNSLYQSLEDKSLKLLGLNLYLMRPFLGNRYILSKFGGNLSGDYESSNISTSESLKYSFSFLYGVKKDPFTSIAFGFNYSNAFGRLSAYPLIAYNKSIRRNWIWQTILPIKTQMTFIDRSRKNRIIGKVGFDGANYNLHFSEKIDNQNQVFLRKTELQYTVTYERELTSWLWVTFGGGFRTNFEFDISDANNFKGDLLVENDLSNAILLNAGFFVVPPKKYLHKNPR